MSFAYVAATLAGKCDDVGSTGKRVISLPTSSGSAPQHRDVLSAPTSFIEFVIDRDSAETAIHVIGPVGLTPSPKRR